MIRHRLDAQVVASASQMDAALAAGIGTGGLVALVELRAAWHETGVVPTVSAEIAALLRHPAVAEWDAVFAATLRRHL